MYPLSKVIRRAFSSGLYGEVLRVRPSISVLTGHVQGPQRDQSHAEVQSEKSSVPLPSIADVAKHFVDENMDSIQINILDKDTSSEKIVFDALKNNAGLMQVGGDFPLALASDLVKAGAKRVVINSFLNSQGEIDWGAMNEWKDKLSQDHIVLGFSTRLDDDAYWIYDAESGRKSSLPLDQKTLSVLAPYCSHFMVTLQPPKQEMQNMQYFLRLCTHLEYESPIPVEISGWLPPVKEAAKSTGPGSVYKKVSIQVPADSSLWTRNLGDFPKITNQDRMHMGLGGHASQSSAGSTASAASRPSAYMDTGGANPGMSANAGVQGMSMGMGMGRGVGMGMTAANAIQRAMSTRAGGGMFADSGTGSTSTTGTGSSSSPGTAPGSGATSARGLDYGSSSGMSDSQMGAEKKDTAESTTGSGGESMRRASTSPTSGAWETAPSDAEKTQAGEMGAQPKKGEVAGEHGQQQESSAGASAESSDKTVQEPSISPVEHDTHAERFVATLHTESGRTVTAELTYKKISANPLIYEFDHTYTPSEMRGKGVAAQLADAAFEFVKEHDGKVLPTCEYIAKTYLKRRPEWDEYVTKV